MSKQREALEKALLALEIAPLDHNSVKSRFFEKRHYAIIALREALAEPKPVSHHSEDALDMVKARQADGDHFGDVTEMAARKPLTDEEIMKTAKETQSAEPGRDGYILPFAFARAVERAHGIGNE